MKLVCIGDSLTEGYGIDLSKRWTEVLMEDLESVDIVNSGISGDTTAGMLARFYPEVIQHHPTHVIIMGGTNDLWFNLSDRQIISNIMAMTRHARHHGIQAIIGIPTPYYPSSESATIEDSEMEDRLNHYQEALEAFALEDGLPVIQFYEGMDDSFFIDDGLHPSEAGHKQMAETAMKRLRQLVEDGSAV
jgi:lysophospholipase L1-like esterase